MPFKKMSNGKYKSPSGRMFTEKQVELYYANGGKFPGQKTSEKKYKVKK